MPNASEIAPVRQVPDTNVSRFTTNALQACRLVERNEQKAGYYRDRCPGAAGFSYEVVRAGGSAAANGDGAVQRQ